MRALPAVIVACALGCTAGEEIQVAPSVPRDASSDVGKGGTARVDGSAGGGGSVPDSSAGGSRSDSATPLDSSSGGASNVGGTTGSGGASSVGGTTGSGGAPVDAATDAPPVEAGSCSSLAACGQTGWEYMFGGYQCTAGGLLWTCSTDCRNCGSDTHCCAPQQTGCPWAGVTWTSSPCN